MDDPLGRLHRHLWEQHDLLERVLFKLVQAELVLRAGLRRYVGPAVAELEDSLDAMARAELGRAVAVADVAALFEVAPGAVTLSWLVSCAPGAYATIFEDHRVAFQDQVHQIAEVSCRSRALASASLDAIQDAIEAMLPRDASRPDMVRACV